ncbi:MAG: Asp23/Gls24 family envelope stress response protein [Oscillospiraceae bacterium]|nr:Asp23/Gls24 family envelope stress response protein [Oscillospiraceae bacterium]
MVKLRNEKGSINVKRSVFTTLTGDAATNCFGVKGMTIRNVSDGFVHMLKPEFMGKGVHVEINADNTISISLHIAVDQGVNIPVVCESIIEEVRYKVTSRTGVEIKRVDIFVDKMIIG